MYSYAIIKSLLFIIAWHSGRLVIKLYPKAEGGLVKVLLKFTRGLRDISSLIDRNAMLSLCNIIATETIKRLHSID
jgi:hypothetical protein